LGRAAQLETKKAALWVGLQQGAKSGSAPRKEKAVLRRIDAAPSRCNLSSGGMEKKIHLKGRSGANRWRPGLEKEKGTLKFRCSINKSRTWDIRDIGHQKTTTSREGQLLAGKGRPRRFSAMVTTLDLILKGISRLTAGD